MTNYLQVNYDGSIFQYSKDPKEGYREFTNTKGKVSYRKYFNQGIEGELLNISKVNNERMNNREELKVALKSGEDINILTFCVLNNDGTAVDEFTESLLLVLPKLQKGETYNINNWFMKKGDTVKGEVVKHNKKGITVKQGEDKIKTDYTFEHIKERGTANETHVKGDVPMLKWKEIAGKNRPTAASKEVKLEFLYNILTAQCDRLPYEAASNTTTSNTTPKQEPAQAAQTATASVGEEEDDLPF